MSRSPGDSRRRRILYRLLLPLAGALAPLLLVEAAARVGLSLDLLTYEPPMQTFLPPGTDDWRLAHITADRYRVPDPLLWWRPVAGPPYNRRGLKGPQPAVPKPPGLVRIIAYGDSNTDGPPAGDWPGHLARLLAEEGPEIPPRRYEVLNAGVAGYTSHQGLLRFAEQAAELAPDVVLVSFGWNDLAQVAAPDHAFRPPPRALVAAQRLLLDFKAYRVARHYLRRSRPAVEIPLVPRVALPDYRQNLRRFAALGREHGATVVLLTRPHRESAEALRALAPDWRSRVPDYNRAVRRLGDELGVPVIDVQRAFAEGAAGQPAAAGLFADECHFTAAGREAMAELVRDRLRRLDLSGDVARSAHPPRAQASCAPTPK